MDFVALLRQRGLSGEAAASLLDSGLALSASVWVAAPAGGDAQFEVGLSLTASGNHAARSDSVRCGGLCGTGHYKTSSYLTACTC